MTVLEGIDRALLCAVLDCIVPPDDDPGASDLGVDNFVLKELASDRSAVEPSVRAGLVALGGAGFVAGDAAWRNAMLRRIESEPWFVALCELTVEGFLADPANGGNRGARSWAMLGYEYRLPNGPSGTGDF